MAMTHRLILAPTESTRRMLTRRMAWGRSAEDAKSLESWSWGAVLLIQGTLPEIFYAADVGAKTSPVKTAELLGNCPQNVISMAFVGAVADVRQVMEALKHEGVIA